VLAACTDARLDNAAFRWLTAQEIEIAGHQVWAFRMSYAGELGWELHMPRAAMPDVYDALWAAGEAHGCPTTAASR
jgi:dimethylglycine dehydrogenase